jgi:hypothetical protein
MFRVTSFSKRSLQFKVYFHFLIPELILLDLPFLFHAFHVVRSKHVLLFVEGPYLAGSNRPDNCYQLPGPVNKQILF